MKQKRETQETGLEAVLTQHLERVEAPEELWFRVRRAALSEPVQQRPRVTWVIVTVLSLVALVWGFHFSRSRSTMSRTAVEALATLPENIEFRSDEAGKIREWVKARTGFDIPLSAAPEARIHFVGAHVVNGSVPAVAVAYRVGGRYAMLMVSGAATKPQSNASRHSFTNERLKDARISSWTMQGQSYVLASAAGGEPHDACGVCHGIPEQLE